MGTVVVYTLSGGEFGVQIGYKPKKRKEKKGVLRKNTPKGKRKQKNKKSLQHIWGILTYVRNRCTMYVVVV